MDDTSLFKTMNDLNGNHFEIANDCEDPTKKSLNVEIFEEDCNQVIEEYEPSIYASAIWKVVNKWLNEEQKTKLGFTNAQNLPTFIHNRHLVKVLGGEEAAWQYKLPPLDDGKLRKETQNCPESSKAATKSENENASNNCTAFEAESTIEAESTLETGCKIEAGSTIEASSIIESSSKCAEIKVLETNSCLIPIKTESKTQKDLLMISPSSVLTFTNYEKDENTGSYTANFELNNISEGNSTKIIPYKITANEPDKYEVYPKVGVIMPGVSASVKVSLLPGNEDSINQGSLSLLYFPVDSFDEDEDDFWQRNEGNGCTLEHTMSVYFDRSNIMSTDENHNDTKCRQIFFNNSSSKSNFCSESNVNKEVSDTTICENETVKKSDSSELSASDENDGIQDESTDAEYSEKLSDMLTMCPSNMITFKKRVRDTRTGNYSVNLRMINTTEGCDKKFILYKIRTNDVKKYFARPNIGVIKPGATAAIRLDLVHGTECTVRNDSYLFTFFPLKRFNGDIEKFWKKNEKRCSKYKRRLNIEFESERKCQPLTQKLVVDENISNNIKSSTTSIGKLGDALSLSPANVITFNKYLKDKTNGRYTTNLQLSNITGRKSIVYKIKSSEPSRYFVTPNMGCIKPGEDNNVMLSLLPENECVASQDLFLILYHFVDCLNVDVKEFWFKNECSSSTYEHSMHISFDDVKPPDVENLNNLLSISPSNVITFKKCVKDEKTGNYLTKLQLNNITANCNEQFVLYKIKSSEPGRYLVKPSVGVIKPGCSESLQLSLLPGSECHVPNDRFFLLYYPLDHFDADIEEFWANNESSCSTLEHSLGVCLDTTDKSKPQEQLSDNQEDLRNAGNFGNLVIINPSDLLTFKRIEVDPVTGRYVANLHISNISKGCYKKIIVFKIKSNQSDLYRASQVTGFIKSGSSTSIRMSLCPGNEFDCRKSKFLLIFHTVNTFNGDLEYFWSENENSKTRFEHIINVGFDNSKISKQQDQKPICEKDSFEPKEMHLVTGCRLPKDKTNIYSDLQPDEVSADANYINKIENMVIIGSSCGSLKVIEFEKDKKDDSTGSYTTDVVINNITKGSSKKLIIYKIKSNEPERYYVKPNCGFIKPGQTVTVKLCMLTGFESFATQDSFLFLFRAVDCFEGDLKQFWELNEDSDKTIKQTYDVCLNIGPKPQEQKIKDKEGSFEDRGQLSDLLIINPANVLTFNKNIKDEKTGRYISNLQLINITKGASKQTFVFKIKSTEPERYRVRPIVGVVDPGCSLSVKLSLAVGSECEVEENKFLLMFHPIVDKVEDLDEFWQKHENSDTRLEHNLGVHFDRSKNVKSKYKKLPCDKSQFEPEKLELVTGTQLPKDIGTDYDDIKYFEEYCDDEYGEEDSDTDSNMSEQKDLCKDQDTSSELSEQDEDIDENYCNDEVETIKNLLKIHPGKEIIFNISERNEITGRYTTDLQLNNMTSGDNKKLIVYKVKTSDPDKYRVKCKVGVIEAGCLQTVTISLLPGNEFSCNNDLFGVMFQTVDQFDGDLKTFWDKTESSTNVEQHSLNVRFNQNKRSIRQCAPEQDQEQLDEDFEKTDADDQDHKDEDDEIGILGDMFLMSPPEVIVFKKSEQDPNTGRYTTNLQLTNITKGCTKKSLVYKIKTTSPEKFRVKPSVGLIKPGCSKSVKVSLTPGNECNVKNDNFLLIFLPVTSFDEDFEEFWRSNECSKSRYEHTFSVYFHKDLNTKNRVTNPWSSNTLACSAGYNCDQNEEVECEDNGMKKLGDELMIGPANEVTFKKCNKDPKTGRYVSDFQMNNITCGSSKKIILFKITTNKIARYRATPKTGIIKPGGSISVNLYLLPGCESFTDQDRFFLLYQPLDCFDGDEKSFWSKNQYSKKTFQHKLTINFDKTKVDLREHEKELLQNTCSSNPRTLNVITGCDLPEGKNNLYEEIESDESSDDEECFAKLSNDLTINRPSDVIPFNECEKDKVTGAYIYKIHLANTSSGCNKKVVLYKLKCSSCDRYTVTTSTGYINPGCSTTLQISLIPGNECFVDQDRFFLLYQSVKRFLGDEEQFWKKNEFSESTYENEMKVAFYKSQVPKDIKKSKNQQRNQCEDDEKDCSGYKKKYSFENTKKSCFEDKKDSCEKKKDSCKEEKNSCKEEKNSCKEEKDSCEDKKDSCEDKKDSCEEEKNSCEEEKESLKKEKECFESYKREYFESRSQRRKKVCPKESVTSAEGVDCDQFESDLSSSSEDLDCTEEVCLKDMVAISPGTIITFRKFIKHKKPPRYINHLNLTNITEGFNKKVLLYKIKTNAPKKYFAKPVLGVLQPGCSTSIKLSLVPKNKCSYGKDRFEIYLHPLESFYGNAARFWQTNECSEDTFRHDMSVEIDDSKQKYKKSSNNHRSGGSSFNETTGKLGDLLLVKPSKLLRFCSCDKNKKTGNYDTKFHMNNISDKSCQQIIIYKFKSTQPDKYRVIPSTGFIMPGCKKSVSFSLTNKDCSLKNHKFLLMYHSVDFFDGNVKEFWNCHEFADSRYEHTIDVYFDKNGKSSNQESINIECPGGFKELTLVTGCKLGRGRIDYYDLESDEEGCSEIRASSDSSDEQMERYRKRDDINDLDKLVKFCPSSVIVYRKSYTDKNSGRYITNLVMRNTSKKPNKKMIMYKLKTTAPEKYFVKPSMGVIRPGCSSFLSFTLTPGLECDVSNDRFLMLIQTVEFFDGDIEVFWKANEKSECTIKKKFKVTFNEGSNSVENYDFKVVNNQLSCQDRASRRRGFLKAVITQVAALLCICFALYKIVCMYVTSQETPKTCSNQYLELTSSTRPFKLPEIKPKPACPQPKLQSFSNGCVQEFKPVKNRFKCFDFK